MTTPNEKNGNDKLAKSNSSSQPPAVPAQPAPQPVSPTSQSKNPATPIAQSQLLYVTQSGVIRRDHRCDVTQQVKLEDFCKLLGVYVDPIISSTLEQYGKHSLQRWLAYFRENIINVQATIQAHVTQAVSAGLDSSINSIAKQMQANMFQHPTNLLASHESIHGEPIFLPVAPGEFVTPDIIESTPTLNTTAHSS